MARETGFYIKVCRFLHKICAAARPGLGYPLRLMVSPRYTVQPTSVEPALELVRKYNIPGPRYTSYLTGELFRRTIAMRFDAYLDRGPRKYSKTV